MGPTWVRWPHEPCYQGRYQTVHHQILLNVYTLLCFVVVWFQSILCIMFRVTSMGDRLPSLCIVSWHGHTYRITGPLWGESASDWDRPYKLRCCRLSSIYWPNMLRNHLSPAIFFNSSNELNRQFEFRTWMINWLATSEVMWSALRYLDPHESIRKWLEFTLLLVHKGIFFFLHTK